MLTYRTGCIFLLFYYEGNTYVFYVVNWKGLYTAGCDRLMMMVTVSYEYLLPTDNYCWLGGIAVFRQEPIYISVRVK